MFQVWIILNSSVSVCSEFFRFELSGSFGSKVFWIFPIEFLRVSGLSSTGFFRFEFPWIIQFRIFSGSFRSEIFWIFQIWILLDFSDLNLSEFFRFWVVLSFSDSNYTEFIRFGFLKFSDLDYSGFFRLCLVLPEVRTWEVTSMVLGTLLAAWAFLLLVWLLQGFARFERKRRVFLECLLGDVCTPAFAEFLEEQTKISCPRYISKPDTEI